MDCESEALRNWHLVLGVYRVSDGSVARNKEELIICWLALDPEERTGCWLGTDVESEM